jgi:transcription initiation factor IIE alpha subunit
MTEPCPRCDWKVNREEGDEAYAECPNCELPVREFDMARSLKRLQEKLEIARGALADIALSDDMTLEVAKNKAARIYRETS